MSDVIALARVDPGHPAALVLGAGLDIVDGVLQVVPTGDADWTTVSGNGLENSWADIGAPYGPVGYRKDGAGRVQLRGQVTGGVSGTAVFNLPSGYRPLASEVTGVAATDGGGLPVAAEIVILADGDVDIRCTDPMNGAVSLNGVSFWAGQ